MEIVWKKRAYTALHSWSIFGIYFSKYFVPCRSCVGRALRARSAILIPNCNPDCKIPGSQGGEYDGCLTGCCTSGRLVEVTDVSEALTASVLSEACRLTRPHGPRTQRSAVFIIKGFISKGYRWRTNDWNTSLENYTGSTVFLSSS
jgi:hypothetical protein